MITFPWYKSIFLICLLVKEKREAGGERPFIGMICLLFNL
jgi:hypothetical protein